MDVDLFIPQQNPSLLAIADNRSGGGSYHATDNAPFKTPAMDIPRIDRFEARIPPSAPALFPINLKAQLLFQIKIAGP
jgi:hypothetical protein